MGESYLWLTNLQEELGDFVFFWNGGISEECFSTFAAELTSNIPSNDSDVGYLVLTTNGGQADAAYKSIRLFQEIFSKVVVVIPSYCKSAGTLMALGAHELHMSIIAELGPLDVQIRETDELFQVRSGLNSSSAFASLTDESYKLFSKFMLSIKAASNNAISFKLSSDIAAKMTCELMKPVFEQVSPHALGSDYRKLHTATAYGERLERIAKNLKRGALQRLVSEYYDHGFVIDFKEAAEIFRRIFPTKKVFHEIPSDLNFLINPDNGGDCIVSLTSLLRHNKPEPMEGKPDVPPGNVEIPATTAPDVGKKPAKRKRKTN